MHGDAPASERVLIVEDEALLSSLMARLLRQRGFETAVAGTLAEAVDALEGAASPFDHVLLDLRLPDGDGESLLAACEALVPRANVVVVAAAQSVDGHRMVRFRGRCEYLPKPVDVDALIAMMKRRPRRSLIEFSTSHRLSRQEHAVLVEAVKGAADDSVAVEIGCRPSTVRTYWSRIYQKTGTGSRDQVLASVVRWFQDGG